MKPLIALSSRDRKVNTTEAYYLQQSYMSAVEKAGGTYIGVLPVYDHDYTHLAEMCDGLLLCGGADTDPKYYNEELHPTAELVKENIDKMDLALLDAFLKADKPVLGICRGHQVINVYYGGSLIQDIPSQTDSTMIHSQKEARDISTHEVTLTQDSFLGKSGEIHSVNSFHHQAIKKLGKTLRIIAQSEDGIVEAIENDHVMGVQWHPECMTEDDFHFSIIKTFINKTKK
ncbi:MAG: gamma-glutamyl-gamma-aminobutyrate hydrolase family protein [Erysipelotrichaceae bacterium]|nr:gamma-glutamyl-gamma-aminobutyrate hydrolase family protein [Erysipelotrichaceae bacterium]